MLLEDHLRKPVVKFAKQVRERGVEEILNDMQLLIIRQNSDIFRMAIMMFCEHPEKFWIYLCTDDFFPKGSIESKY